MSRFFIDRPIFATVLALVIVIIGLIACYTLPIAEYPEITPPTIVVTCQVSRCQPASHCRYGRHTARTGDQRCGADALYGIAEHQRWANVPHDHLPARH